MSHIGSLESGFRDLECMKSGVAEKGGTFVENKQDFNWWGVFLNDWSSDRAAVHKGYDPETFGKCLHVIRPPGWQEGDYEIGVVKNPKGDGYNLMYDSYGRAGKKIEDWAGLDLKGLMKPIKMAETRKFWQAKGKRVVQDVDEKGRTRLKVIA